jgi:glucose/arabinose dehydrogenase
MAVVCGFCTVGQTYNSTTLVSGLQYPVAFDVAPDGRFFITEKGDGSNTPSQKSRIRVYTNSGTLLGTFYDLSDSTISTYERGVLGIALDPDFVSNHYVYAYYNHLLNNDERIRIVRFTEASNIGTNPLIIFDLKIVDTIHGHVSGNLHFRPSQPNHIYFTIGDLANQQTNPTLNYANKLTKPFGKVLRINKNGTIPTGNPFYDDGDPLTANCDWIWSYGHRNPFDFCFSPVNDSMYCSENGVISWDEVNLISKGSFYGWAQCEGNYITGSTTTLCNAVGAVDPITSWGAPLPAVTGILFYSGSWNALNNHLLVAEYNHGIIYDCTLGNPPAYNIVTDRVQLGDMTTTGGLTTLKQSNDGCIYAMNGGYTTDGSIYKICPTAAGIMDYASPVISFIIYPIPSKNYVTIEMELSEEKAVQLLLMDFYSRTLKTELSKAKAGKTIIILELNQQDFSNGIYFIQLQDTYTKQILTTKKIIVE